MGQQEVLVPLLDDVRQSIRAFVTEAKLLGHNEQQVIMGAIAVLLSELHVPVDAGDSRFKDIAYALVTPMATVFSSTGKEHESVAYSAMEGARDAQRQVTGRNLQRAREAYVREVYPTAVGEEIAPGVWRVSARENEAEVGATLLGTSHYREGAWQAAANSIAQ